MRNNLLLLPLAALMAAVTEGARLNALVYRGPAACEGCPEAVAELLESSPWKFNVAFAGPEEDIDVDEHSLKDLDDAWRRVKKYKKPLQDFVSSGGHYLGFCLGAYLAGHSPGFGLLPHGSDTDSECEQPESQVTSDEDTVIQVDWTFVSGKTEKNRWLYFQEGPLITGLDEMLRDASRGRILARYSKSGDIAAAVTPYGNGWVGLVGPHPEATQDWYSDEGINNPDGISFDVGYDLIAATLNGGRLNGTGTDRKTQTQSLAAASSTAAAVDQRYTNPFAQVMDAVGLSRP
ncbi:hypothetical protein ACJZ2D_002868 [Fusarium nematophilum]